jgi:hypothetical protein
MIQSWLRRNMQPAFLFCIIQKTEAFLASIDLSNYVKVFGFKKEMPAASYV